MYDEIGIIMFKFDNKKNVGFSLVELLVVLAVLGIITVVVLFSVTKQLKKSSDAAIKNDLETIKLALFEYYDDNKCFPDFLPDCGNPLTSVDGTKTYLNKTPCQGDYTDYGYEVDGTTCNTWFKILGNLNNTYDKSIDLAGCRNKGCGYYCQYNYGLTSTNIAANAGCETFTGTIIYACTPPRSQDKTSYCVPYPNPTKSKCPSTYDIPTCNNECNDKNKQCKKRP